MSEFIMEEVWHLDIYFPQDGGSLATEMDELVRHQGVRLSQQICNLGLKSSSSVANIRIKYDETIVTKFREATDGRIFGHLYTDTEDLINGVVPSTMDGVSNEFQGDLSIEILDFYRTMDIPYQSSFVYPTLVGGTPYKVFDLGDTPNSVIHRLLTQVGLTAKATGNSVLAPNGIDSATVLSISGSEGEGSILNVISTLCFENGYMFRFDGAGEFYVVPWTDYVFNGTAFGASNIGVTSGVQWATSDLDFGAVEVEYSIPSTLEDVLLYRLSTPYDGDGVYTGLPILAEAYIPATGFVEDVFWKYRADWLDVAYNNWDSALENEDIRLIHSSGHTMDLSKDAEVSLETENYESKRCQILFKNTDVVSIKRIYYCDIKGDALFRSGLGFSKSEMISGSGDIEPVKTKYIYDSQYAARLSEGLKQYSLVGRNVFTWTSRTEAEVGSISSIEWPDLNIDTDVFIFKKTIDKDKPLLIYEGFGVDTWSAGTPDTRLDEFNVIDSERIEDITSNQPTFEEVVDGFDAGGGTTTIPTLSIERAKSLPRGINIDWEEPTTFTPRYRYNVQVSDDSILWYIPRMDGVDWKGTINLYSVTGASTFTHSNIPLPVDGGGGALALNLYYRIRVEDLSTSTFGTWSSGYLGQALAIDNGDLATNSIFANSINAGSITTDKVDALAITTAKLDAISVTADKIATDAIQSTNWSSSAGSYFDLSAGRLRMGGSSSPKVDFNPATGIYSFEGAVTATSGTFTGAVYASSGSFTGAVYASSGTFAGSLTSISGNLSTIIDGGVATFKYGAGTIATIGAYNSTYFRIRTYGGADMYIEMGGGAFQVYYADTGKRIILANSGNFYVNGNLQTETGSLYDIGTSLTKFRTIWLSNQVRASGTVYGSSFIGTYVLHGGYPVGNNSIGYGTGVSAGRLRLISGTGLTRTISHQSGY